MRANSRSDVTLMPQFAIRPTLRNHNILTRDGVIKQLASIIGPGHEVNLKNYDLLVVVEIFKVGGPAAMQFPKTSTSY